MNDTDDKKDDAYLKKQSQRLRDLVTGMNKCCEDRHIIEKKRFSLPVAETKCLLLFREEKYLTVKGIAAKLDVAKSRVTILIDSLVKKGFVTKIDDPNDARIKLISLSGQGKLLVEEIQTFQDALFTEMLLRFDEQERATIINNLETLRSTMEFIKQKHDL